MSHINKIFKVLSGFISVLALNARATASIIHVDDSIAVEKTGYEALVARSGVSGDELKSFTSNIWNNIEGHIPGVTVLQSSELPGSGSAVVFGRGLSSFTGSNTPIVIIDGFESTIDHLSVNEIDRIEFLKDASATAVYGLRGANGVISVTTRKGAVSPLRITFQAQAGMQQAMNTPKYLDSYNFAALYNEAERNNGVTVPTYSADALESYRTGSDPYLYPSVDWYREVMRKTSPVYNAALSFTGGSESVKYYVLLDVMGNESLLRRAGSLSENSKNPKYNRYNVRSNLDIKVTDDFSAAVKVGVSVEDNDMPGSRAAMSGFFDLLDMVNPNSFPVTNPNGSYGGNSRFNNPLGILTETGYVTSNARTLNAQLRLTEKLDVLTPGLSVSGIISFNNYHIGYSEKAKDYERYSMTRDDSGNPVYQIAGGQKGTLVGNESESSQWRIFSLQGRADYERRFGIHAVEGMAFFNYDERTVDKSDPYRHIGFGGRVSYTLMKRYIAGFSFGIESSEVFDRGRRTGFFPAGALAWIISDEDFLKENSLVNFLKLRVSYGLTGNDNIGGRRFMYKQNYIYRSGYPLGTASAVNVVRGISQDAIANPDVTWERDLKFNIGLDATVIDRLYMSADYFSNRRNNILCIPYNTVPSFIGGELPYMNLGKVSSHGFEISTRWSDTFSRHGSYYVALSAAMAKSKILYNSEAPEADSYRLRTGRPVSQPYYLEAIGFYTQEDIDNPVIAKPEWKSVQPGDIRYKDQNGDNVINNRDFYPIGHTDVPEITLGLGLGAIFRGFDISAFFQCALNRDVYLDSPFYKAFQNRGKVSEIALNRWTPETASTAAYPRLSAADDSNNYQASTFWLENGDFLKLRNLEIGYTFVDFLKSKSVKADLRIYANATNLFSLDHVKYSDPEILSGYPAIRTYSFGLKLNF